jgi:hypothetical protein
LLPAIALYRAERAAAVARGADLTTEVPHAFTHFRDGRANYTWRPTIRIDDGCYLATAIR